HHAHLHQGLDDVDAAFGHAIGEFLDRDGLGDDDVAQDLLLLLRTLVMRPLLALEAAAERGNRPHALVLVERAGDAELAGAALGAVAAATRGRLRRHRAGAGATLAAAFLFIVVRRTAGRRTRRGGGSLGLGGGQ